MLIRQIEHKDIDVVVALSESFYDEMNFDSYGYRFDKQHITKGFRRAADTDSSICFVAETDANIVGVIFFTLSTTTWYFTDRLMATEIVWHSDPKCKPFTRVKIMQALLDTSLLRLKEMGCKLVVSSAPSHEAVAIKLLQKHGFSSPQTYFMKEFHHGYTIS